MKKAIVFLCIALGACATSPAKKPATEKPKASKEVLAETNSAPNVTLSQPESTLGETVANIGEKVGGSLVLINGIESRPMAALDLRNAKFSSVVEQLAAAGGCKFQQCPNYALLYPDGYDPVLGLTVAGMLDPVYGDKTAGMAFGADTPLYEVFTLLSNALGVTIVADNLVADAKCGTLALARIPLQDGLEALLKSARLMPAAFKVESTPEYIFFYATQNATPPSALLNPESLSAEQNALLDKKVDVTLPAAPDSAEHVKMVLGATPLHKVLGVLSQCLGVEVAAEPGLEDLPINPCAFRQVRVRTAMDLVVRQWIQPEFGYRVDGARLIVERRK